MPIILTASGTHRPPGQRVIRRGNGKDYWLNKWDEYRVYLTDYHINRDGKPCLMVVNRFQFESCYDYPSGSPG